ncbi:MAG: histidine kinase dimerization/phospho-acceptor domain-containing protein [Massiliimalia sp.]|jgi:signal transduction histidine kinase
MWNKKNRMSRLGWELIGSLLISFVIALFSYVFLDLTSLGIVSVYLERIGKTLTDPQQVLLNTWVRNSCFFAAVVIYISLFLFFTGQKIGYLIKITRGIASIRESQGDGTVPVEGDDELTDLARAINYLADSQREFIEREQEMQQRKEQMIRALSHDIRTPLTSILSYAEYLKEKDSLQPEQVREAAGVIGAKGMQIKELTSRLLEQRQREFIEDGRLLFMQLAEEWEEELEETHSCQVHWENCHGFSGYFDLEDLRRIFDNLASNIKKYADSSCPIVLTVETKGGFLTLIQQNKVQQAPAPQQESHGIGLNSIRQIAESYQGQIQTELDHDQFIIRISFKVFSIL